MSTILLTYRRTRRLSMRIAQNGDVHVSAPLGLPRADVERFIARHADWIAEARRKTADNRQRRDAFYAGLPLTTREQRTEATSRLKALVEPMLQHHSHIMGVAPNAVCYKPMISRWGVCNVKNRTISFSLYLLLLPDWCIEHVVVHELCHLLEPAHNARFYAFMDRYYPRWREARLYTRRLQKTQS